MFDMPEDETLNTLYRILLPDPFWVGQGFKSLSSIVKLSVHFKTMSLLLRVADQPFVIQQPFIK